LLVHASVTLAPVPESAAEARDFVASTLRTWECGDVVVDDARVVVTELVSNVVRHAGTTVDVDVDLLDGCLRVGVTDRADGTVAMQQADDRSEDGRGLRLVDELAQQWGVDRQPGEKCVWVEWRVAGRPAARA
jgi:anti-sigma regulatory factor (Ser/Thr protein kinase)